MPSHATRMFSARGLGKRIYCIARSKNLLRDGFWIVCLRGTNWLSGTLTLIICGAQKTIVIGNSLRNTALAKLIFALRPCYLANFSELLQSTFVIGKLRQVWTACRSGWQLRQMWTLMETSLGAGQRSTGLLLWNYYFTPFKLEWMFGDVYLTSISHDDK